MLVETPNETVSVSLRGEDVELTVNDKSGPGSITVRLSAGDWGRLCGFNAPTKSSGANMSLDSILAKIESPAD